MSSFALYLVGTIVVMIGLAYGAHLIGIADQWIAVGALVILGAGILAGVPRTKQKDPSGEP